MVSSKQQWMRPCVVAIAFLGVGALCWWSLFRTPRPVPNPIPMTATVDIHLLSSAERIAREQNRQVDPFFSLGTPLTDLGPIPDNPPNNPLLHVGQIMVAKFKNTTGHLLTCFDGDYVWNGEVGIARCFIVDVEVWDGAGKLIGGGERELEVHRGFLPPAVPSADFVLANKHQTFTIQPGEEVELGMAIFSSVTHPRPGLQPGTYTLRATVSYAEAPSGEKKTVASELVPFQVTEAHIKAAEGYWEALAKWRDAVVRVPSPREKP